MITTDPTMTLPEEFVVNEPPQIDSEAVDGCPVCSTSSYSTYATGFDYESQTCSNEWRFVQCDGCSHVRLHPRPTPAELPTIYPPTYYAYNYEEVVGSVGTRAKIMLDRMKLLNILKHLPEAPKRALDIGCGDGRFLRVLEEEGTPRDHLYGLELDASVTDSLTAEGFNAYCRRVEDGCDGIPKGEIDLATMFHVIEHVGDVDRVVQNISEWLAPGGVLAVETPNVDSSDAKLFKDSYWGGYHIPRHWHLFTPDSLQRLFENNGLEVVTTRFQPAQGMWMYSFHHKLRYGRNPQPRVARWFDPFVNIPLSACFVGLDMMRARLGCKTSAMLMLARKPE